jgi:uncharacterized protein YdgA (DUF945 family)
MLSSTDKNKTQTTFTSLNNTVLSNQNYSNGFINSNPTNTFVNKNDCHQCKNCLKVEVL